jgi:hypothetical protein
MIINKIKRWFTASKKQPKAGADRSAHRCATTKYEDLCQ